MTKKVKYPSRRALNTMLPEAALAREAMADIPDFTDEQWAWLKAQSRDFEKDYIPTRSLIPGV